MTQEWEELVQNLRKNDVPESEIAHLLKRLFTPENDWDCFQAAIEIVSLTILSKIQEKAR